MELKSSGNTEVGRDVIGGDSRNQSMSTHIDLKGLVADINAAAIANARELAEINAATAVNTANNAKLIARIEDTMQVLIDHHGDLNAHREENRQELTELRSELSKQGREFAEFRTATFELLKQLSDKSDGIVNKMAIQQKFQELAALMGNG